MTRSQTRRLRESEDEEEREPRRTRKKKRLPAVEEEAADEAREHVKQIRSSMFALTPAESFVQSTGTEDATHTLDALQASPEEPTTHLDREARSLHPIPYSLVDGAPVYTAPPISRAQTRHIKVDEVSIVPPQRTDFVDALRSFRQTLV